MQKQRKKFTRQELKHDPLMDAIYKARGIWQRYEKQFTLYGGIALVVIIIGIFGNRWQKGQDNEAAAVVGVAFTEYSRSNYNVVIDQLTRHVENYSGLPSFGGGLFILAKSEMMVGDTTFAKGHFEQYVKDYDDALLTAAAYSSLGTIHENRGEYAQAAVMFSKASKKADTKNLINRFILSTARNYVAVNRDQDAVKLLQPRIDNKDVEFPILNEYQTLVTYAREKIKRRQG